MANRLCTIYELQPIDLHEGKVSLGSHHGKLLSDNETELLPILMNALGTEFQALQTRGDGACAVHSVWGSSHITGALTYAPSSGNLRDDLYALLPTTFSELRHILGTSGTKLVENIDTFLWNELAYPGARGEGDREAALFWDTLRDVVPDFATYVEQFILQKQHDDLQRRRDADHYQFACNAFFQIENEETLIRPFLGTLQLSEFPVDLTINSRYLSLFKSHGEPTFDTLRRSVLDSAWNEKRTELHQAFEAFRRTFASNAAVQSLLKDLQRSLEVNEVIRNQTFEAPPNFAQKAWSSYRRTITSNQYWFSTTELLLFAVLTNTNLVITKYSTQAFHIVASVSHMDVNRPIVYVSFNGILRGHFERIWPKEDIEQLEIAWRVQQEEELRREQARVEEERQRKKLEEEGK